AAKPVAQAAAKPVTRPARAGSTGATSPAPARGAVRQPKAATPLPPPHKKASKTAAKTPKAPSQAAARAVTIPQARVTAHAVVENLRPLVEHGLYPAKAVLGDVVTVTADVFRDGHEKCEADLLYRRLGEESWRRTPLSFVDNDAWAGSFLVDALGEWQFTIEARTRDREGYAVYGAFEQPYHHPHYGTLRVDPRAAEFAAWYEMFA